MLFSTDYFVRLCEKSLLEREIKDSYGLDEKSWIKTFHASNIRLVEAIFSLFYANYYTFRNTGDILKLTSNLKSISKDKMATYLLCIKGHKKYKKKKHRAANRIQFSALKLNGFPFT